MTVSYLQPLARKLLPFANIVRLAIFKIEHLSFACFLVFDCLTDYIVFAFSIQIWWWKKCKKFGIANKKLSKIQRTAFDNWKQDAILTQEILIKNKKKWTDIRYYISNACSILLNL